MSLVRRGTELTAAGMSVPPGLVADMTEGGHDGFDDQAAHVVGDDEYHATVPFPVTIVPSELVTIH